MVEEFCQVHADVGGVWGEGDAEGVFGIFNAVCADFREGGCGLADAEGEHFHITRGDEGGFGLASREGGDEEGDAK